MVNGWDFLAETLDRLRAARQGEDYSVEVTVQRGGAFIFHRPVASQPIRKEVAKAWWKPDGSFDHWRIHDNAPFAAGMRLQELLGDMCR